MCVCVCVCVLADRGNIIYAYDHFYTFTDINNFNNIKLPRTDVPKTTELQKLSKKQLARPLCQESARWSPEAPPAAAAESGKREANVPLHAQRSGRIVRPGPGMQGREPRMPRQGTLKASPRPVRGTWEPQKMNLRITWPLQKLMVQLWW